MTEHNAENDAHRPVRTYVYDSLVRKELWSLCSCGEYHMLRVIPDHPKDCHAPCCDLGGYLM